MKIHHFEERESWKLWRLAKITGSRLKDIFSPKGDRKVGFYALIAESFIGSAALAEEEESLESAMARGTRLEPEAIERFRQETKKKVTWCHDDTGWAREDDPRIAVSPDGFIGKTAVVEAKCLGAPRHIEALVTKKVPKEYDLQVLQHFIVNDRLKTVFVAFYNPLFPKGLDFFYLQVKRKDKVKEIEEMLAYELDTLSEVRRIVNELTPLIKE